MMLIIRFRLYASTCRLISVRTFLSRFIRKCCDPIQLSFSTALMCVDANLDPYLRLHGKLVLIIRGQVDVYLFLLHYY